MARSDAYSVKAETPVKKYIKWSSNKKCFTFYDKNLKADRDVKLPLTLVYFDSYSSIKGFSDKSQSSIYSNEVKSTKTEPLFVRSFKGGEIVSGLYQDIKLKVVEEGGHYNASVYAMIDGEIVNIEMKGAVLQHWSEFTKDNFKKFLKHEIVIPSALDAKKGSVKYSVPVFELGGEIAEADGKLGDQLFDELQAYFVARKTQSSSDTQPEEPAQEPSLVPTFEEPVFEKEDNPLPF
jgi:hypothetical protein